MLNRFQKGEYVLAVNNHFYFHYEYALALVIKYFQKWVKRSKHWQYQHKARLVEGVVIEMNGKGRQEAKLDEWIAKRRRTVAIFQYDQPFADVPEEKYGFLDLIQIGLHHIRKAFGIAHEWNGVSGVPKKWNGNFCSEETGKACRDPKAHTRLPCEAFEMEYLTYIGTIRT